MTSTSYSRIQACLNVESKHAWQENLYVFGMNITDRIQELLEARGVKPRGVRRALSKTCGISYQAVSQWFSGETANIKNDNLTAIAEAYDTSVDWLLTGKGRRDTGKQEASQQLPDPEFIADLLDRASPNTKLLLQRIEKLAEQGKLAEEDLALLNQIVGRLEAN